ncbi:MAG: hypothetical protein ACP5DZ_01525 [Bacteroidales bacterium]
MIGEILQITIPALLVLATAIYMMQRQSKKEHELKLTELALNNQKTITPLRLQAYERVVIFLERITPNSIVFRLQTPTMTAGQLHKEMLELIRAEYEHNLSQQLYLSSHAWGKVKQAKELTIKLINEAADSIKPDDNALQLSRAIFDKLVEHEKAPTHEAIDTLKEEIHKLFS